MILSIVERSSFMSWRWAPSILTPMGTPCPSVSRRRFTPPLPRSVGVGPVFFPAQRGFGHGPVHGQPLPVDPPPFLEALDASLPECEKDVCLHPFLEPIVRGRMGTQLGLVEGLPRASRSQDRKDRVGAISIRDAWSSTTEAMGIDMHRQQWLQHGP